MHLNSGTADVFMPASIAGASDQLRESMLSIAKMSAQLERAKLQQQIAVEVQKQQRMSSQTSKSQSTGSDGSST